MDFATAISTGFRRFVDFSGRSRRSEYWYFYLFYVLVAVAVSIIDGIMGSEALGDLWSIAMLIPMLSAAIRRMHDIGKSGWFILIPIYNIILLATDTVQVPNQWGNPAK
jgi:uncharacterized membrane protein YhaH (DUF805 family)